MTSVLLALVLTASCYRPALPPTDGRFAAGAMAKPRDGYTDSPFLNHAGDRLYFTHSYLTAADLKAGTITHPVGEIYSGQTSIVGAEWNTDLYYVEWKAGRWSEPINMGGSVTGANTINSIGNECCVWLSDDETEIIFYSDKAGLSEPGQRPTGNYRATRANRDATWSTPVLLPGTYGATNQTATLYRHDIQKTPSGDLYLWERDETAGTSTLLYGQADGSGGWLAPVTIASMTLTKYSQPWISPDELTMVVNSRGASGDTDLVMTKRASRGSAWGAPVTVPLVGFEDTATPTPLRVWGEPTFGPGGNYMLYVQFDTSVSGWKVNIRYAKGSAGGTFSNPVQLNQ